MRRWLWTAGFSAMLPLAFGCSSDSYATPVSPETVEVEAVTAAVAVDTQESPEAAGLEAVTAQMSDKMQVCHIDRRSSKTGDWVFEIVRIPSKSLYRHLWHGDVQNECSNAMAVGDDCWSCAVR